MGQGPEDRGGGRAGQALRQVRDRDPLPEKSKSILHEGGHEQSRSGARHGFPGAGRVRGDHRRQSEGGEAGRDRKKAG